MHTFCYCVCNIILFTGCAAAERGRNKKRELTALYVFFGGGEGGKNTKSSEPIIGIYTPLLYNRYKNTHKFWRFLLVYCLCVCI